MVQHRAARFVFHDYSRISHITSMIGQLGWDSLEQRRLLSQATMFYKTQQGLVGIQFPPEACPLNMVSRMSSLLPFRQLQPNNNVYKYLFYPRTIVTWNQLPMDNLPMPSVNSFKVTIMPTIKVLV